MYTDACIPLHGGKYKKDKCQVVNGFLLVIRLSMILFSFLSI